MLRSKGYMNCDNDNDIVRMSGIILVQEKPDDSKDKIKWGRERDWGR